MKFGFFFVSAVALLASHVTAWQLDGRCYTWICREDSKTPKKSGQKEWRSPMCDCLASLCRRRLGDRVIQKTKSIWYDSVRHSPVKANELQASFERESDNLNAMSMSMEVSTDDLFHRELRNNGNRPSGGGAKLKMWWHEWSCWQYETISQDWCVYAYRESGRDATKTYVADCGDSIPGREWARPNNQDTFGWDFEKIRITDTPSMGPSTSPSSSPSASPTVSMMPSAHPSSSPSSSPSSTPSSSPSSSPSNLPTISHAPTSSVMPSISPSISFETIAMAKFLDNKEEKKQRSTIFLATGVGLLIFSLLVYVAAKYRAKTAKLSRTTLIAIAGLVLFSLSIFILAIVVMVTPNTLETRPIEDSQNQRRELEEFVPSTAYQIRSTKLDLCMTTLWVPPERGEDSPDMHRFQVSLKKCVKTNVNQLFTIDRGENIWDEVWDGKWKNPCKGTLDTCFELHPYTDPESCINNPHHPKTGEKLHSESCKIPRAKGHQTHYWELIFN
eukprot:scaffold143857_cov52-Attheya_sp.AAC.2